MVLCNVRIKFCINGIPFTTASSVILHYLRPFLVHHAHKPPQPPYRKEAGFPSVHKSMYSFKYNLFCITFTYKKEVLSQGSSKITNEGILFVNKQALVGVSLYINFYNHNF